MLAYPYAVDEWTDHIPEESEVPWSIDNVHSMQPFWIEFGQYIHCLGCD